MDIFGGFYSKTKFTFTDHGRVTELWKVAYFSSCSNHILKQVYESVLTNAFRTWCVLIINCLPKRRFAQVFPITQAFKQFETFLQLLDVAAVACKSWLHVKNGKNVQLVACKWWIGHIARSLCVQIVLSLTSTLGEQPYLRAHSAKVSPALLDFSCYFAVPAL